MATQTAVEKAIIAAHKGSLSVCGVTVTYSRTGQDDLQFKVIPGRPSHDLQLDQGATVQSRSKDFSFLASELDFGAGQVEPARHDTITWGETVYKILTIGNQPAFRYADQYSKVIRVHCMEV